MPVKLKMYFRRFFNDDDEFPSEEAALAQILSTYSKLKTATENISKIKNSAENLSPIESTDSIETANKFNMIRVDKQISL